MLTRSPLLSSPSSTHFSDIIEQTEIKSNPSAPTNVRLTYTINRQLQREKNCRSFLIGDKGWGEKLCFPPPSAEKIKLIHWFYSARRLASPSEIKGTNKVTIHKNFKQQQTELAKLTAILTAIVAKTVTIRGRQKDCQKVKPGRLIERT